MRIALRHFYRRIQVKFARPSVVIKPVSNVAVLLKLDQRDTGADRVDGPGRNVEEVSGPHFVPCQQLLDRTVDSRRPELPRAKRGIETDRYARVRLRIENIPALLLARHSGRCLSGTRVDLDRKFLAGEKIFDQQCGNCRRRFEPDSANSRAWRAVETRRQVGSPPDLLDRVGGQQYAHLPLAPPSWPTFCADLLLVTSTSSPSTTTITSSSPITDTRGPSVSTATRLQSISSCAPREHPLRASNSEFQLPMSDQPMVTGTIAAFCVFSITA